MPDVGPPYGCTSPSFSSIPLRLYPSSYTYFYNFTPPSFPKSFLLLQSRQRVSPVSLPLVFTKPLVKVVSPPSISILPLLYPHRPYLVSKFLKIDKFFPFSTSSSILPSILVLTQKRHSFLSNGQVHIYVYSLLSVHNTYRSRNPPSFLYPWYPSHRVKSFSLISSSLKGESEILPILLTTSLFLHKSTIFWMW